MIYCKQIPPEYQESRLFDDEGMGPDYINVTGNRDYISRTSSLFDRVYNALENGELAEALDDIKNGGYYSSFYKNATDAINDLLEPEKARYNTRDIHALKELAAVEGCFPSDLVLYVFEGYTRIPQYKAV